MSSTLSAYPSLRGAASFTPTKRHRSRVHAWAWPTSKGGTGGVIPPRLRTAIIDGAKRELGADLAFADFEPRDGEGYLIAEPVQ